jgi:hypothetical protein
MGWQDDPIVSAAQTGSDTNPPAPWENDPILFDAKGAPQANVLAQPKQSGGILQAIEAGAESSVAGLAYRGKLPDVELDPQHSHWYERAAQSATQMALDLPFMVAGAVAGGAAGGAAGTAVPLVGNAVGGAIGAGAGAFAVPGAIREAYIQAYKNGEITSSGDFLSRANIVLKTAGKEALIGATTAGLGRLGKLGAETVGFGSKGIATSTLAGEYSGMVVTPSLLEGKMPELNDFIDGAVMVGGFKAVHHVSGKIADVYAKTGASPAEIVTEAYNDPQILDDLGVPKKITPEIQTWRETSVKPIDATNVTNSSELVNSIKTSLGDNHFVSTIVDKLAPKLQNFKVEVIPDSEWKFRGFSQNRQAQTNFKTNTIEFRENIKPEAAFHELLHEATFTELKTNSEFAQNVRGIMDRVRGEIAAGNVENVPKPDLLRVKKALKNEAEFVAYGLSSPEVINTLRGIRGEGSSPTMFTTLVGKVTQDLGFESKHYSALHDLIRAVEGGVEEKQPTVSSTEVKGSVETGPVVEPAPVQREIPRAYEQMAREANAQEAVPSEKAKEVLANPFAEVTQLPGQPARSHEVNYNYINAADDVKGAMARLSQVFKDEIDKQRNGKVSWETSQVEAGEYLNKLLGAEAIPVREPGTPAGHAELLARMQLTEGAVADMVRKAQELKDLGTEASEEQKVQVLLAIDRAAMIQAEFLGARAEAGRALNILKASKRTAERAEQIKQIMERFGNDPAKMADMILALDSPEQAAKLAREATKATTYEKFVEAWKSALVSGPITQIANIAGNVTFMASRPVIDLAAAGVGMVRGAEEGVYAREAVQRLVGNFHGSLDGAKVAWQILKNGAEIDAKSESRKNAIEGKVGEIVRLPFRALSAGDALFNESNKRGEIYSQATRQAFTEGLDPRTAEFKNRVIEIATNPPLKMLAEANDVAKRFTFNAPLGEKGRALQNFVRATNTQWLMPFIQTPANVLKEMVRLTPAAPILSEWRADFEKGGAYRDRAIAEIAVGTSLSVATSVLAHSGMISGNGDPDPKKRATMIGTGWQPYSFKNPYNGKWYSYQRLQPIGTLVGLAADIGEHWDHFSADEKDYTAKTLAMAFSNAVTNQTFLVGLTQSLNAFTQPEEKFSKWMQSMAGSMVPGVIGQTNQLIDPYQRQVYDVFDAVKARIPGLSQTLQPKRDIVGEPIPNKERAGYLSPVTVSEEKHDVVRSELARLGILTQKAPGYIDLPAMHDKKLGKVELTAEQKDVYSERAGKFAHQILKPIMSGQSWASTPDIIQKQIVESVFKDAREVAKNEAIKPEQLQKELLRINTELQKRMTKQK